MPASEAHRDSVTVEGVDRRVCRRLFHRSTSRCRVPTSATASRNPPFASYRPPTFASATYYNGMLTPCCLALRDREISTTPMSVLSSQSRASCASWLPALSCLPGLPRHTRRYDITLRNATRRKTGTCSRMGGVVARTIALPPMRRHNLDVTPLTAPFMIVRVCSVPSYSEARVNVEDALLAG